MPKSKLPKPTLTVPLVKPPRGVQRGTTKGVQKGMNREWRTFFRRWEQRSKMMQLTRELSQMGLKNTTTHTEQK